MTDRCIGAPYSFREGKLYGPKGHQRAEPHKWQHVITANHMGRTVQYRNTGCNQNGGSPWYDVPDAMVEGKGIWSCITGACGICWDWQWMEYRIKPEAH